MSVTDTIFDLIDMRSFSNLWYWIALAVTWSSTSHWVLGVPFDMVLRARRKGGQAAEDLVTITRVNVGRLMYIGREGGLVLAVLISFVLTSLALLGFWYRFEFAQAIFLLAFPLSIVGMKSLAAARAIERRLEQGNSDADTVARMLARHRFWVQVIGMMAITVTAFYGMLQNFHMSVFG